MRRLAASVVLATGLTAGALGCAPPPVHVGPIVAIPVVVAPPGTHWRIIGCNTTTQRCIRWLDAQTAVYYQGPYDPDLYRRYGIRSDCAFLPGEGDAYVSEVQDNRVADPPPQGCPT